MKLEEALRQASADASRSVAGVRVGEPPTPPGPRRSRVAIGTVLVTVAALALAVSLVRDDGAEIAAEAANVADVGAPPLYVTGNPPEGLSLVHAGPVAGLESIGTEIRWVYGVGGRVPAAGERAIVVMSLSGRPRPAGLLQGADVDINGRDGSVVPSGIVMFETAEAAIMVSGQESTIDDLLSVAREIEVAADGTVIPPETAPGGYELLGSFDQVFFEEADGSVPADAQVATYRQGYQRYLSIVSRPRSLEVDQLYQWLTPVDAETTELGGRTFTFVVEDDDLGALSTRVVWYDKKSVGEVVAYGVDRDQVEHALRGLRLHDAEVRDVNELGIDGATDSESGPASRPPEPSIETLLEASSAPTLVLDGMEIVNAVDHGALPTPDWQAEQYVFGPLDIEVPGAADPVLLLAIAPASDGLLKGDPTEIGGHKAVVVDKRAAGTTVDVEMLIGETTVQLTGRANIDLETIIAAGEQYAAWTMGTGGLAVGVPETIGVDLHLRQHETTAAWFAEDVNGPAEGTTIVYAEPGSTSTDGSARRLTVSITPSSDHADDWLSWLYPAGATPVQVGDVTATSVKPSANISVVRFRLDGETIQIVGVNMEDAQMLTAIESFAPKPD